MKKKNDVCFYAAANKILFSELFLNTPKSRSFVNGISPIELNLEATDYFIEHYNSILEKNANAAEIRVVMSNLSRILSSDNNNKELNIFLASLSGMIMGTYHNEYYQGNRGIVNKH